MKAIWILVLLAIAQTTLAAEENFSVTNVGVNVSSQIVFVHVDHSATSSTCSVKYIFIWNLGSAGVRDLLAVALAAQAAGKRVTIGVSEGGVCVSGHATGAWLRMDG